MCALPPDYSLFTASNQADPIPDHLISPAYFYPHDRTDSPPAPESVDQEGNFDSSSLELRLKQDPFQRPGAGDSRRQPESLISSHDKNNKILIPESDLDSYSLYEDRAPWTSQLALESLDHLPSVRNPQEDFYQDLDQLGILDYLRSDQDFPAGPEQQFDQLGLDWLELQADRQKPGSASLARPRVDDDKLFGYSPSREIENHGVLLACSSCGVTKPHFELSRLWPCCHPHCNTCINTLINASCNDPPPPQMVCFFCSQHVHGFDPPSAFVNAHNTRFDHLPSLGNPKFLSNGLDRFEYVNFASPPSDQSGFCTGSFSSVWSPNPTSHEGDKLASALMSDDSIPLQGAPGDSCPWPVIRVDNISWSLTVADIVAWLPGGLDCLPPPELCPLPIHILCTPTDGKTLNHCFIEARNLTAAHFVVRHRHGTKIGNRPCSVVLTSSAELHSKILGIKENETSHEIMKTVRLILKLCAPHSTSSIKSPERPFYHLMSLLSHCAHLSEGGTKAEDSKDIEVVEKWTNIHQIAIESLFGWKIKNCEALNILHLMVNVAISSSLIDKPTLFRFLSHVEVFG
ncbi:hypothetical protein PtA15_6A747 [Puccinia triticina]|uniref:Uncharacterized protein n=1 Tax=Puccinia triticina TaxID=208348 RepID=A0ABY7CQ56_9BASI|nr:uncharacterized protein PtA15_6A747 [Puccinia triticina]WAQ86117.1 hypothetical protein PtA15_6A747 [Puccinia triticina]